MKNNFEFKAFTLAELLITMAIIGVVVGITIPTVMRDSRKQQYRAQFKKVYNQMTNAYNSTKFDMGGNPACFYWSPGSKAKYASYEANHSTVKSADHDGDGKYDGYDVKSGDNTLDKAPSDWNGWSSDCSRQHNAFLKKLKVIKTCSTARTKNGGSTNCAPYYAGIEDITLKKKEKENKDGFMDKSDEEKETEIYNVTYGAGLKRNNINKAKAYYLIDGSIYIPVTSMIMVVDINGKRGPNRWGHDVYSLYIIGDPTGRTNKLQCYSEGVIEDPKANGGGYTCSEMLKK